MTCVSEKDASAILCTLYDEFRLLNRKKRLGGLTKIEEQRIADLRVEIDHYQVLLEAELKPATKEIEYLLGGIIHLIPSFEELIFEELELLPNDTPSHLKLGAAQIAEAAEAASVAVPAKSAHEM